MVVQYTIILYSIIVRAKMVCIDYRIMIYSIEWALKVLEEKSLVELDSIKFVFTIIKVKLKMIKGIIMVKTEEDWKYHLIYNCIIFIEWIDGLSLKSHIECFLVIIFYMFDLVVFISIRYKQYISCAWNNISIVTLSIFDYL